MLRTREIRFLGASLLSVAGITAYSISYNTIDYKVLTIPTFHAILGVDRRGVSRGLP